VKERKCAAIHDRPDAVGRNSISIHICFEELDRKLEVGASQQKKNNCLLGLDLAGASLWPESTVAAKTSEAASTARFCHSRSLGAFS
jgi:hypothetical protein